MLGTEAARRNDVFTQDDNDDVNIVLPAHLHAARPADSQSSRFVHLAITGYHRLSGIERGTLGRR